MANRDSLDPFGDGSLVWSWTFTDDSTSAFTLDAQQGGNVFPATVAEHTHNKTLGYNTAYTPSTASTSTNPVMPNGDVDATFSVRIDCAGLPQYGSGWVYFGESNQRYNVGFTVQDAPRVRFYLHKNGVSSSSYNVSATVHHLTLVYSSATQTSRCYIDGVYKETLSLQMKFISSKLMELNALNSGITDIEIYNRSLSDTEVSDLANDNFTSPTVTILADNIPILATLNEPSVFYINLLNVLTITINDPVVLIDRLILSELLVLNIYTYEASVAINTKHLPDSLLSQITTNPPFFEPRDDLLFQWSFTDGVGDITYDSDPTGVLFGGTAQLHTTSPNGHNELQYGGQIPSGNLVGVVDFTLSVWVNCVSLNNNYVYVGVTDNTQAGQFLMKLEGYTSGAYTTAGYFNVASLGSISGDTYSNEEWVYLTMVYDSSNTTISYYENGVWKKTLTQPITLNSNHFIIVNNNNNAYTTDIQFFTRVLNNEEINFAMVWYAVKALPQSILMNIEQLNKYYFFQVPTSFLMLFEILSDSVSSSAELFRIFLELNNTTTSQQPLNIGQVTKISAGVLEPTVQGGTAKGVDAKVSLPVSIVINDITIGGYVDVTPDVIDFNITPLLQNYVGVITGGGIPPDTTFSNKHFAQVIDLKFSIPYITWFKNSYVVVDSLLMDISFKQIPLWETVIASSPIIRVNVTSSVAQPDRDKRVVQIGSTVLDTAMYYSVNEHKEDFISTTVETIDGNSIYSISPLREFTRSITVSTNQTMSVTTATTQSLISEVNEDSYDIIFSDGTIETVKNDLTSSPLLITPIFDGADRFYITLGFLL